MMKNLICALLALWHAPLAGQVAIVPAPAPEGFFGLDQVWQVRLISPLPGAFRAVLEVTLEDDGRRNVFSATSPEFTVTPGAGAPSVNARFADVRFGAAPAAALLRGTGRLPYGRYVLCYRLLEAGGKPVGESCLEKTVLPFAPPELLSPFDRARVPTPFPVLAWKPPLPVYGGRVEYRLRLAEARAGEDALAALERNAPLLDRRVLSGTQIPYPGDAPRLEPGRTYVWQVTAATGGFDLGTTEAWTFTVETEGARLPPVGAFKSFRELKLSPDGGFAPVKQKLLITYNNRFNAPHLDYEGASPPTDLDKAYFKIYPVGKQSSPLSLTSSTALQAGVNALVIDIHSATGITDGADYVLVLRDPAGREHYLEFTYHN